MEFPTLPLQDRLAEWLGGGDTAETLATLIIVGMLLFLYWMFWLLLNRFQRRIAGAIEAGEGRFVRGITIQKQRIVAEEDVASFLQGLNRWVFIAIRILVLLFLLNIVFSQFHWSRGTALKVIEFGFDILRQIVAGIIAYLPNLFIIIVIVLLSRLVLRLIKVVFDGIRRERIKLPGFYPEWARTSYSLTRLMVIALTIIIVFPYLPGSDSPAFQGLSIFFGVLLSLGSTSAIANIISGIVITYTRAFRLGDRVKIADTEGDVIERSAFVTRLRTPKNVEVAIPNAMVMSDHIINYSAQAKTAGVLLHTTITIGYDVPWPKVQELLKEAARRTDKLIDEPEPFVLQTSLDDNYVAYELNAYTRQPSGKQRIYSDLHANIQDCFHAAGVEIMSPHYRANRDGSPIAIPPLEATEATEEKEDNAS